MPAVSVARIAAVIEPSFRLVRLTVAGPLPVTWTTTVWAPSKKLTSADASASRPLTVKGTAVFSALLTRLSPTATERSWPASAVVSRVVESPVPVVVAPSESVARIEAEIEPSFRPVRSAVTAPLPMTWTTAVWTPSEKVTSAVAPAASPATVKGAAVFSALFTRASPIVTARVGVTLEVSRTSVPPWPSDWRL